MLYLWKDHSGVVNNNLYEAGRYVVPLACLKPRIICIQNREPFGLLLSSSSDFFFPWSSIEGIKIELLDLADERVARVAACALVIECLD